MSQPKLYVPSVFTSIRRPTRQVSFGGISVGGDAPIRVQSMTTTPTWDAEATIAQIVRLADVGCEITRVTVPTKKDALALPAIREGLLKRGIAMPLVADIHFAPALALFCCDHVDKVRINPGNYIDTKKFQIREYSDQQYQDELKRLEDAFTPLVIKARKRQVALRIGTNHGSLSDRIVNRYGDSPQGMVESALEFARICRKNNYDEVVMSMKSSNPIVMIQAYRLLAARMAEEGLDYPFHLGVTEAGDGLDARVKSAVGIGALLLDGIGDTVRVSLTEDPTAEVPVGFDLIKINQHLSAEAPSETAGFPCDPYLFQRRSTSLVSIADLAFGERAVPRVEVELGRRYCEPGFSLEASQAGEGIEIVNAEYSGPADDAALELLQDRARAIAARLSLRPHKDLWAKGPEALAALSNIDRIEWTPSSEGELARCEDWARSLSASSRALLLRAENPALAVNAARRLRAAGLRDLLFALPFEGLFVKGVQRARQLVALAADLDIPILLSWEASDLATNPAVNPGPILGPASALGAVLCDGIGDGIRVPARGPYDGLDPVELAYVTLQATRYRTTRTEYVSCPGCGRTLFDLEETTQKIRGLTGHLPNVKIAIMGCIVNGPGEMADANFGYVGWKPGKVDLYVGKDVIEKAIDEAEAPGRLVELLKRYGAWVEPPVLVGSKT